MTRIIMIGAFIGALAFVVPQGNANAALMDGKALLNACKQPSGSPLRSICLGYVAAISDALAEDGVGTRKACFAKGTKLSVMRDTVIAHLENQTRTADKPASNAVTVALVNKFTC